MDKNIRVATEGQKDCLLLPGDIVTYAFPMTVDGPEGRFAIVGEIEFFNDDGILRNSGPMKCRQIPMDHSYLNPITQPSGLGKLKLNP